MRRNAFGSNVPAAALPAVLPGPDACAAAAPAQMPSVKPGAGGGGRLQEHAPVDTARAAVRGRMRIGFIVDLPSGEALRRFLDRRADAHIGRAAAEIAGHRLRRCRRRWACFFFASSAAAAITWPDWQ